MQDISRYYFVSFVLHPPDEGHFVLLFLLAFVLHPLEVARIRHSFQGGNEKMQKASGVKRIVFLHLPTLGFRQSHSFLLWISLTMAPINCHSVLYSMYQNIAL